MKEAGWLFKSKKAKAAEPTTPATAPAATDVEAAEKGDSTPKRGEASKRKSRFSREGRKSKEVPEKAAPEPATLKQLSLTFEHGQLTMIAGAVGCGKSSLLGALLGELRPASATGEDGEFSSSVRMDPASKVMS